MKLYTIGHSNHSLEQLIGLLEANNIARLVDVRSTPYSRYNPQFNKGNLDHALAEHSIEYVYAGNYLGGRPTDPTCYKNKQLPTEGADYIHEVDYPEVMKRQWFIKGIDRLLELADEEFTVIMCSEEDPALCHRHHLIAKYLLVEHPEVEVRHIRGDGTVFGATSLLSSINDQSAQQLKLFE